MASARPRPPESPYIRRGAIGLGSIRVATRVASGDLTLTPTVAEDPSGDLRRLGPAPPAAGNTGVKPPVCEKPGAPAVDCHEQRV